MRHHNFQTISWFWDLYQRDHLNLDSPYQRRSVWNQTFRVTPARIPLSISLLQFAIGVLTQEHIVFPPLRRYVPLITEQLADLYPEVMQLTNTFDLQLVNGV
jgi:hypothetical protein